MAWTQTEWDETTNTIVGTATDHPEALEGAWGDLEKKDLKFKYLSQLYVRQSGPEKLYAFHIPEMK